MTISEEERTEDLGEGETAVAQAAPSAARDVSARALRDVIVDLAFKPAGSTRILLDDFQSEPSWGVALKLWFGDHAALRAPFRRDRIVLRSIATSLGWTPC
jgi:hypothetical protein